MYTTKTEAGTELTMITPENAPAMKTNGPMMYNPNQVETLNTSSPVMTQTTSMTQPSNSVTSATTVVATSVGNPNSPSPSKPVVAPTTGMTPPVTQSNPTVSDLF